MCTLHLVCNTISGFYDASDWLVHRVFQVWRASWLIRSHSTGSVIPGKALGNHLEYIQLRIGLERWEGMRCWNHKSQEKLKVEDSYTRSFLRSCDFCTDQSCRMSNLTVAGIGLWTNEWMKQWMIEWHNQSSSFPSILSYRILNLGNTKHIFQGGSLWSYF